jgi:serine/threonine protein kinase
MILFPSTTFSILAICFKPYLRKKLLQYGWKRTADIFVPNVKGEVRTLSVKVAELEAFLAKQRLPRIKDVTPEINPSDMTHREKDVLGSGGYGYVLKGAFKGEPVAIKAMFGNDAKNVPASVTKMMRREAMIMCSLNHPNILKIHGVVSERGWIVMELCEGGALDDILHDPEYVLNHSTRLRIAAETATGIAYLHLSDVSIVHGDLKAGNVLLTKDLSVRICDFGMSEAKNRSRTMTVAASSSGKGGTALTVAWSAPELFMDRPKSFATDIYALGLTLWEIYERRVPFGNMPEAAVVNQVLSGRRPEIASTDMPEAVRKLIQLCWSDDPGERPAADKMAFIISRLASEDSQKMERQKAAAEAEAARRVAEEAEARAAAAGAQERDKEAEKKAKKAAEKKPEDTKKKDAEEEKQGYVPTPTAQAFCEGCGAKLLGVKFCVQCGKECSIESMEKLERQKDAAEAEAARRIAEAETRASQKKKIEEDEAKARAKDAEEEKQRDVPTPTAQTFCMSCGAKLSGVKFCVQCGAKC